MRYERAANLGDRAIAAIETADAGWGILADFALLFVQKGGRLAAAARL